MPLLLVIGGAGWLYASAPSDRYGNGIVYAMAVAIGGLLSVACLLGTSLALLLNRGRRKTAIALIAWVLTVLTCATPLVIALLR